MSEISVILNVYKRPYSLEKQIQAIKNQTVKVDSSNIHVWFNTPEDPNIKQILPSDKNIKVYQCNHNTKFFGRFTIPLLCKTKYIAMFDDDIIPGDMWLENCLNSITKQNGIYGGSGILLHSDSYLPHTKIGWNQVNNENITQVDLVGHAWFFKKEHAKFMWLEEPVSWDNGEDMFFSYVAQKNGVNTFVPPHPKNNIRLWSNDPRLDNNMGRDVNAHSLANPNHLPLRNSIVKSLINKGWKKVK
jgi:hypothetical protein